MQYSSYTDAQIMARPRYALELILNAGGGVSISDPVRGKNLMSGLCNLYKDGYALASIYQLYEVEGNNTGLFSNTGTPLTPATYLHNLSTILNDPGATKKTFTPAGLAMTIGGLPTTARWHLFQKSTGSWQVVIWNNVANWNNSTQAAIVIAPSTVTVNFPLQGTVSVYDPTVGTTATSTTQNTTTGSVSLTDHVMVVDYLQGTVTPTPVPVPVPTPTPPTPTPTPTGESAQGASISKPADPALVNAAGERWTMVATNGGQVAVNGTTDTTTSNVTFMLYYNHQVYQQNSAGNWYVKTRASDTWAQTTDPRTVPTPTPNPTPGPAPLWDGGFGTNTNWMTHGSHQAGDPWAYGFKGGGGGGFSESDGYWSDPPQQNTQQTAQVSGGALRLGCIANPGGFTNTHGNAATCVSTILVNFDFESGLYRQYGYYEFQAKLDNVRGFLLHFDIEDYNPWNELDIDIWIDGAGTHHVRANDETGSGEFVHLTNIDVTQTHTYGMDWQSGWVRFYVDGVLKGEISNNYNRPFGTYFLVDTATYYVKSSAIQSLPAYAYLGYYKVWDTRPTATPTPTPPPVAPTPTPQGSGQFRISGGNITDPQGANFIACGLNVGEVLDPATVLNLFPRANFIRMALGDDGNFANPSWYADFISYMTSRRVVCMVEDHSWPLINPRTGSDLTNEANGYAAWANIYKNNPYVWFSSANEPQSIDGMTAEHVAVYNAIRNASANNMILFECGVGSGNPGAVGRDAGLIANSYSSMRGVMWDLHQYGWMSANNQTDVRAHLLGTTTNATGVRSAQLIQSADGVMPVIIAEFGPSTNGSNDDANAPLLIDAVTNWAIDNGYTRGFCGWQWSAAGDQVQNGGVLTAWGRTLRDACAAHAQPGATPTPPTPTPPPSSTIRLAPGDGRSFTDGSGNVYTLTIDLVAMENGSPMAGGGGTDAMELYNGGVYARDQATQNWYSWDGANFSPSDTPPAP